MYFVLTVPDKRYTTELGYRQFRTYVEAVKYIRKHKVYTVCTVDNSYVRSYTPNNFIKCMEGKQ